MKTMQEQVDRLKTDQHKMADNLYKHFKIDAKA
jgi:hypothetical protein